MAAEGTSQIAAQILVIDYVFAGVFLLSLFYGLFRGFIREVLSLVSWVVVALAAFHFGPQVAGALDAQFQLGKIKTAAGYAAVFFGVLIVGAIVTALIARLANAAGMGGTDRILGMVFGAARGLAMILVVTMLVQSTIMRDQTWWKHSYSAQELGPLARELAAELPSKWQLTPAAVPSALPSDEAAPADPPTTSTPKSLAPAQPQKQGV